MELQLERYHCFQTLSLLLKHSLYPTGYVCFIYGKLNPINANYVQKCQIRTQSELDSHTIVQHHRTGLTNEIAKEKVSLVLANNMSMI